VSNIGISSLASDVLALLDHGKLLRGADGFDLVPGHGYIAGDIAMKGHAAADFAQKLAGELIAVGESNHVRRRRRSSLCVPRGKGEAERSRQHKAQKDAKPRKDALEKSELRHRDGTFLKKMGNAIKKQRYLVLDWPETADSII
jgi:hypothetical protein